MKKKTYIVRKEITSVWTYEVKAESVEEAEELVIDGDDSIVEVDYDEYDGEVVAGLKN